MFPTDKEKESGQSVLIIAFVIMILLALVAVVVDVGNAYAHRRMVQNAVDAAALAGARQLANKGVNGQSVTELQVWKVIKDFAEYNAVARTDAQGYFIAPDGQRLATIDPFAGPVPDTMNGKKVAGVEVLGNLPFETYFAHLIGFPTMIASTNAQAWVLKGPCSGDELFPIGIDDAIFRGDPGEKPVLGKTYTMWDKTKEAPGQFGWLYWEDGNGVDRGTEPPEQNSNTTNLRANIEDTTRSGKWNKDDWVHGSSGVSFNSVMDALQTRMNDSKRTVVVPIYDQIQGTGDNQVYRIMGFAAFNLTCAYHGKNSYAEYPQGSGACDECTNDPQDRKCIKGQFVRWVTSSAQDGCVDTGIVIPSFRRPVAP